MHTVLGWLITLQSHIAIPVPHLSPTPLPDDLPGPGLSPPPLPLPDSPLLPQEPLPRPDPPHPQIWDPNPIDALDIEDALPADRNRPPTPDLDNGDDPGSLADRERFAQGEGDAPQDPEIVEDVPDEPEFVENPATEPKLEDLAFAQQFVDGVRNATLAADGLPADVLARLLDPPREPPQLDANSLYSLKLFMSTSTAAEHIYTDVCADAMEEDPKKELLSHYKAKKLLEEISGVCAVTHDMCIASCHAFTGPYQNMDRCHTCGEPRYETVTDPKTRRQKQKSRLVCYAIPPGPQIQARRSTPAGCHKMRDCARKTRIILEELVGGKQIYTDIMSGKDYLDAYNAGLIGDDDCVLVFSMDGAQLFRHKASDCWIYIWIIIDLSPEQRYKQDSVLIGGIIPGPNKPKDLTSFIFPGFHHVRALQNDGMYFYDHERQEKVRIKPYVIYKIANGPGLSYLDLLVGHPGFQGCCERCEVVSRRKPGERGYYPAHKKPHNYDVPNCNHDDFDVRYITPSSVDEYKTDLEFVMASNTMAQFKERRRLTGIKGPSIISGLQGPDIPQCIIPDLMHLFGANIPELLSDLWLGKLDCDRNDSWETWDFAVFRDKEVWQAHGATVEDALPYLPGSFDKPPRNPSQKINSGYRAWEFIMWLCGVGPVLFRSFLPRKYWLNFCKLVFGFCLFSQRRITKEQVRDGHAVLVGFVDEFEDLYYQRMPERIHFCRHSIHGLVHIGPATVRAGPLGPQAQWTMERTIGNVTRLIQQPSLAFQNLAQVCLRRAQVTAAKAVLPELDRAKPAGSNLTVDIGDGYTLLHPIDSTQRQVKPPEGRAVCDYMNTQAVGLGLTWPAQPFITRQARISLPSGQIARSLWKEEHKGLRQIRMARMIKVKSHRCSRMP